MAKLTYSDKNNNTVTLQCESVKNSGDGYYEAQKVTSWSSSKSGDSGSFPSYDPRNVPIPKSCVQNVSN